jgi:hypothetical protein
VRNRTLHQSLRDFSEQAAFQLEADATGGAEIPFEVIESPGARAPLYCYRPLTGQFIRERLGVLGRLPTYPPARRAIEALGGVDGYLRVRGEPRIPDDPGERADAALRSFLSAMFVEATEFEFSAERFARAYEELEGAVYESRALTAVVVPVHGLELESDEIPLSDDLALVRATTLDDLPGEAVWSSPVPSEEPNVLAVLRAESAPGEPPPLDAARERFGALLRALRLVDAAGFALGSTAWSRTDAGPWQLAALGIGGGVPVGAPYRVAADEEDELRGFCNLAARRSRDARGEVAWALRRFELGCARDDAFEALTDHLLSLRSLLEPEGPSSGRLAQRLAAICATPDQRAALAERTAYAISLERGLIGGLQPAAEDADALVADMAHHLRALLRDVLCGHLDSDLVGVADAILAESVTGEEAPVAEPDRNEPLDQPTTEFRPFEEPEPEPRSERGPEPEFIVRDTRGPDPLSQDPLFE